MLQGVRGVILEIIYSKIELYNYGDKKYIPKNKTVMNNTRVKCSSLTGVKDIVNGLHLIEQFS